MTDDIIKRAEAVLEGVMPGPWTWETESGEWPDHSLIAGNGDCVLWWDFDLGFRFNHENDARFIAAARDLIPDLLADHKAALARVEALEAAQIMLRAERDGLASLLLSVQQDSIAATKALATARADGIKEGMRLATGVPLEELPAEYDRAMKDAKP
jgi:hypothetical protein